MQAQAQASSKEIIRSGKWDCHRWTEALWSEEDRQLSLTKFLLGFSSSCEFIHRYSNRSRWTTETVTGISDSNYWVFLSITHECRKPWNHVHLHLQKHICDAFFHLVTGDGDRIYSEFDDILDLPRWTSLLEEPDISALRAEDKAGAWQAEYSDIWALVATCVACNAPDMQRRILDDLETFPLLFLWFACRKHSVACPQRLGVCQQLKAMKDSARPLVFCPYCCQIIKLLLMCNVLDFPIRLQNVSKVSRY